MITNRCALEHKRVNRRRRTRTEHLIVFYVNDIPYYDWTVTAKRLREFCDAATDALNGEESAVGAFIARPHCRGIRIEFYRERRTYDTIFPRADLETLIADIDDYLSSRESQ